MTHSWVRVVVGWGNESADFQRIVDSEVRFRKIWWVSGQRKAAVKSSSIYMVSLKDWGFGGYYDKNAQNKKEEMICGFKWLKSLIKWHKYTDQSWKYIRGNFLQNWREKTGESLGSQDSLLFVIFFFLTSSTVFLVQYNMY